MLLLLLHKPSKQSEHSGLSPDTSSLVYLCLKQKKRVHLWNAKKGPCN